jgi:hypothetical protein
VTKIERLRSRRLSNGSARIVVSMRREAGIGAEPALADVRRPGGCVSGDQELRLAFERARHRPGLRLEVGSRIDV